MTLEGTIVNGRTGRCGPRRRRRRIMTLEGTIVNGVIVLEAGARVPEGTRVYVDIVSDFEQFEYPHPMAPYDREKEIALLQASHDEMKAGARGQTLAEFDAEFRRDFNLSSMPVE